MWCHAEKLYAHLRGVAEQMASQGGEVADPQEVAETIYECATSETPVHNPVGSDAQMITGMINSAGSRQEFLDQPEQLVLPQGWSVPSSHSPLPAKCDASTYFDRTA